MSLLIDGYNLLHGSGILGPGRGQGALESSRSALINFLIHSIEPRELARTTLVFDAASAPPGLPRTYKQGGLTIRFASTYEDADALIEELIRADSSPRRLTVVSSDHRLQRAAHRRKARAVDSDVWYQQVCNDRKQGRPAQAAAVKPSPPASPFDVEYWCKIFDPEPAAAPPPPSAAASKDERNPPQSMNIDPFPPGYADDVFEEEGF